MKIKLSKFYWMNLYVMTGVFIIVAVSLVEPKYSFEDLLISLFILLGYAFLLSLVVLMRKNYLMTMEIEEKVIRSFLFGKLKCELNIEQEVYYAIFKCNESNTNTKNYIAISNERFIYEEKERRLWSLQTFIDNCDMTKVIVLPYDEKIENLFAIENWTRVNRNVVGM